MGDIQDALLTFQGMMGYQYHFVISHKKVAYNFELTFIENIEKESYRFSWERMGEVVSGFME